MSTAIAQHHDEARWLAARRKGIGGSDVAALFGLHPFKSGHDVWREKTGRAVERIETPDMRRGKRLEDIAAQLYTERTGRRLRRQPLRRHTTQPLLLASIDRQILAGPDVTTGAAEFKVPRTRNFYRWKREGLPAYIILQGQHEALVWGYSYTAFGIYGPDDDALLSFDVPADAHVSARILEFVPEWWERHVVRGIEPELDAKVPDVKLPDVPGEVTKRTDEDFARAAAEFFEARELEAEAAMLKAQAKDRILALVDNTHGIYEADGVRFYFTQKPGNAQHAQTLKAVRARRPLDPVRLAALLHEAGVDLGLLEFAAEQSRLDIDELEVRGRPFDDFRGFQIKPREEE